MTIINTIDMEETSPKKSATQSQVVTAVLAVVAVLAIGASIFFYMQYQNTQKFVKNPGLASQLEVKELTTKVGMLMTLPKGEDPTVATVSDITKLKGQPFFANAQNGDKVLLYVKAKKAILYSPKLNKIINVEPLNVQANTVQPIRIALYNGTANGGLTTKLEDDLKTKTNNTTVSTKASASRSDYGTTLVVDLTGNQAQAAQQLAQFVGGQVAQLPNGEKAPADSDLLVIIGGNFQGTAAIPTQAPAVQPTAAATVAPTSAVTPAPTK